MLAEFWFTFFYQPVFNALVWIYSSSLAGHNLGWSVIWLTVFLRILLLPLTIKAEKDALKREKAQGQAVEAARAFKGDIIAQKEEFRRIMKRNKISPWAKVLSLGLQLLMLILLYQVFIGGIEGRKVVTSLYSSIDYPGVLNTSFYGFDIGARYDYVWAGICALYLFAFIFWENRKAAWDTRKATYLFLFPLFTFVILWWLPMVKSLFILTSMVFSDIIGLLIKPFLPKKKAKKKAA